METYTIDKSFYDVGVSDLKELWDSDLEPGMDVFRDPDDPDWGLGLCDSRSHVVLYDRLMTDAAIGAAPIKSEHSYSLASDAESAPDSPLSLDRVMDEMEDECWPLPRSGGGRTRGTASFSSSVSSSSMSVDSPVAVKDEPLSEPASPTDSCPLSPGSPEPVTTSTATQQQQATVIRREIKTEGVRNGCQQSVLKQPTILLTTRGTIFTQQKVVMPKLNIKVEPNTSGFSLPPTPPSSTTSDSEGNVSPDHEPSSPAGGGCGGRQPVRQTPTRLYLASASSGRQPIQTPLISSQPKGSTGMLFLTEEEKRTLLAEGYPIPTRLPLTKAEEKSLKKIRRKIKNKISAQESRRKKKEYMDALERKVELLQNENSDYKKKIENLEDNNASLLSQLQKLQALVARGATATSRTVRNADSSTFLTSQLHSSRSTAK